jgi:hypothetical protein
MIDDDNLRNLGMIAARRLVPVTLDTTSSIVGGSSVLTYEFKRDLNTYLSRLPANHPARRSPTSSPSTPRTPVWR